MATRLKKKSHRGIAKRVKLTATGKVRASRVGYQHKLTKKRKSRRRQARRGMELVGRQARQLKSLLQA